MGEINDSRIKLDSNTFSRNTPIALVVGAAGFLGSFLVEELLKKNIQVLGVDNLSTGKRANLEKASKNRNFHLVISSAEGFNPDLPRLDYLFIVAEKDWDITNILDIFRQFSCKLVFVSSIDLYDRSLSESDNWFVQAEKRIAKFAAEHNLNARIVRLSAVYGPRMHFRTSDPVARLIQAALKGGLQKESTALEFSARALYVNDAIDLVIKSMLVGATAQKIFDGALLSPVKVTELKQVLLDPVWYESKGFTPSDLPPWPTPNLEKTVKHLSWKPTQDLLEGFKETISYFKDNEIEIPALEDDEKKYMQKYNILPQKQAEERGNEQEQKVEVEKGGGLDQGREKRRRFKRRLRSASAFLIIFSLIFYSLIWPVASLGWGVLTFRVQLGKAADNLKKGSFDKSIKDIDVAKEGVEQVELFIRLLEPIEKGGFFKSEFSTASQTLDLAKLSVDASKHTVNGISSLYQGLKEVTGESVNSPKGSFENAQLELAAADEQFSMVEALIDSKDYKNSLPPFFQDRVESLKTRIDNYSELVRKARAAAFILPQLIALEGKKDYLVILQNNNELRATGGFIGSFAKVAFERGKLKKFEVQDVYAIDGQLKIHVEPPKEIKEDLSLKDWFLRDANWEPDFPTSARQIAWFYNRETGERVEGVIALDISAVENLLTVVGELDLPDYKEKITSENLFSKSITYSEANFFPGSQAKKSFLGSLANQLFNKLFFLPNQNWPGIVSALGKSMEEKHLMVYLESPQLFSYLASQSWAGILPRATDDIEGVYSDLIFPIESNFGVNKANYYLERSYLLDTTIGKDGQISHRLRIKYVNRSPSDTFPAGVYKNRFRIYLPLGTKLNRGLWGEEDITDTFNAFVDYGRTGYSVLLQLDPKQEKTLVLDYGVPRNLSFKNGKGEYMLNVIKQPGTLNDPFEWKMAYPINYNLTSQKTGAVNPQELIISTDLSTDKLFQAEFSK
ncbi:DUF4012 domain-containing protein [Candidatus Daviesbacteria bacterium]|nr:DUF4012 domain-containing protein [Candidatus Daviesbacteria bacterium]